MFTGIEVEIIQVYLEKIVSGKKQKYFHNSLESDPEWDAAFPLFKRLIDYAVNKINDPEEKSRYNAFHQTSSDSQSLFENVYQSVASVKKALETYILHYRP